VRRHVSRADIAALRKRSPTVDPNPIGVIVRQIIDPDTTRAGASPIIPQRTALQEALVTAALAAHAKDGKVRRLILDSADAHG
jgi:hypothetical protein